MVTLNDAMPKSEQLTSAALERRVNWDVYESLVNKGDTDIIGFVRQGERKNQSHRIPILRK